MFPKIDAVNYLLLRMLPNDDPQVMVACLNENRLAHGHVNLPYLINIAMRVKKTKRKKTTEMALKSRLVC